MKTEDRGRTVDPLAGVVERMERVAGSLNAADGVARFNDLYLAVTREVLAGATTDFEDPEQLARLDAIFAGLYFRALDADGAKRPIAHAWRPLFQSRAAKAVAPIQFALAGMNAHINNDLPSALVEVMAEFGVAPTRGTPLYRDYLRVNALLATVEAQVKKRFEDELLGIADEALGLVDDVVAIWSVARARDAAWNNAHILWALLDDAPHRRRFLDGLDRMVGLASRGLLVRTL